MHIKDAVLGQFVYIISPFHIERARIISLSYASNGDIKVTLDNCSITYLCIPPESESYIPEDSHTAVFFSSDEALSYLRSSVINQLLKFEADLSAFQEITGISTSEYLIKYD